MPDPRSALVRLVCTQAVHRPAGYSTGWRRLGHLLIEVCGNGGWRVEVRDREAWTAGAGEGHLVLPHTEHRLTMTGTGGISIWALVSYAWDDGSEPYAGGAEALRVPAATMRRFIGLHRHVLRLDGAMGFAAAMQRAVLLQRMLLALPVPWQEPRLPDPRIRVLLIDLDENPEKHHTCSALAAAVGLNRARFHALFSQATGLAPQAWLTRRRMRRAEELLASSTLPVAEIAACCGYPDPFHFSRVFRRHTRQSPRAFRRAASAG